MINKWMVVLSIINISALHVQTPQTNITSIQENKTDYSSLQLAGDTNVLLTVVNGNLYENLYKTN